MRVISPRIMNTEQARKRASELANQLHALADNAEGRTVEEIQSRLRDLADVAESIETALTSDQDDYVTEYEDRGACEGIPI